MRSQRYRHQRLRILVVEPEHRQGRLRLPKFDVAEGRCNADSGKNGSKDEQTQGYQAQPEGALAQVLFQCFFRAVTDDEPLLSAFELWGADLTVLSHSTQHIDRLVYRQDALSVTIADGMLAP